MKIAVIGAGPAGIMASLAAENAQVDLYEQNEKIGKKLYLTGKGRCNITNSTDISNFFDKVITNANFLYSSFYSFDNEALIHRLNEAGLKTKVERGGRVFPESDKSSDVIKIFQRLLNNKNINIYLNKRVEDLIIKKNICSGIVVGSKKINYNAVILCSGGLSYSQTGSDGFGLKLAKKYGHQIIKPEAGLVGLKTKEDWLKEVSGLSLKNVSVKLFNQNKKEFEEIGECLFTHFGLSGPIILTISSLIKKPYSNYKILIDLKPGLSEEKLNNRLLRDFKNNSNKDLSNAIKDLLPKNLIDPIIKLAGLNPKEKINSFSKESRFKLIKTIKHLKFTIKDKLPLETAIITRGGIDTKEINPNTMESKIIKNLYFAGEVIDVDALTGGYNIQIACSTGFLAGSSASYANSH